VVRRTDREREVLERCVRIVAEQAAKADALVHEALAAGLDGSHALTMNAKILRLELLHVKADLERELEKLVSIVQIAGVRFTGCLDSASHLDTGRTGSQPLAVPRDSSKTREYGPQSDGWVIGETRKL
jgi:hypothetical protein